MNFRKKRILIVEDHPLVREGLVHLIAGQEDVEICGQTAEATEALRLLPTLQPDLVIIDLSLKVGSGLELISQIRAIDDRIKILIASMHDELLYADRCLHAGAMGYIMKQEDTDELLKAIRQILEGNVYFSPRVTNRMMLSVANGSASPGVSAIDKLTNREIQVLDLIGRGLTTVEIAEHLHLSVKTIETHRENVKHKLNLSNGTELVRFAIHFFMQEHPPA